MQGPQSGQEWMGEGTINDRFERPFLVFIEIAVHLLIVIINSLVCIALCLHKNMLKVISFLYHFIVLFTESIP